MRALPTPLSPALAMRTSGSSIEVPDGQSVAIGFFSESYPEVYRIARISVFEDLQTVGLVPKDLSERDTIEAITADDAVFRESVAHGQGDQEACCADCARPKRRSYQSNLASVLSKGRQHSVSDDNPDVLRIHYAVNRLLNSRGAVLVGIAFPDDIDIGEDATLFMAPTVHLLNADVITIKGGGVLRFESANVHVSCTELNGPHNGPVVIPDLDIPKFVLPDELTVGRLLTQLPSRATSEVAVVTAHKYLPGFDAEYVLAHSN